MVDSNKLEYDYSKLLGRIVEKYGTQAKFAEAMKLSERSLSRKLNNKVGFRQIEIVKAAELLEIHDADIPVYFFTYQVEK